MAAIKLTEKQTAALSESTNLIAEQNGALVRVPGVKAEIDSFKQETAQNEATLEREIRHNQHRIDNLEAAAQGYLYRVETDSADAYVKTVPADALPWAVLDSFGGNVTGVEVQGINLYNDAHGRGTAEGYAFKINSSSLAITYGTTSSSKTSPVHLLPGTYALTFIVEAIDGGSYPDTGDIYIVRNAATTKLRSVGTCTKITYPGYVVYKCLYRAEDEQDVGFFCSSCSQGKQYRVRLMIAVSDKTMDFVPYKLHTEEVPESIRALNGYGNDGAIVNLERGVFVNSDGVETDISSLIPDDWRYLGVEAGGTITFVQADNAADDVPSEVSYMIRLGGDD